MGTTALTRLAAKALPALSGASVTYNPEKNVFLLADSVICCIFALYYHARTGS